ncbi:hypothetical protein RCL1_000750 [Eukaryota sp. TZLM3-RCL]
MTVASVDPFFLANVHYRQHNFDACISLCNNLLSQNPQDQAAVYLKCKALSSKNYLDELEIDEDSAGDLLLDSNTTSDAPRPGTSFSRPTTTSSRPMTGSGRPITGFSRPGTSRPTTKSGTTTARQALTARPGTSRPATQGGRLLRLGTASINSAGKFVDPSRLDFSKYVNNQSLCTILYDYLLNVEHLPKKALELAILVNNFLKGNDWSWNFRLARAYKRLAMYKDAETYYNKALKLADMATVILELSTVYSKLDIPNTALNLLNKYTDRHPYCTNLLIQSARIHEQLNNLDQSTTFYKDCLRLDPSSLEATSCVAVSSFYDDQPEAALRLYKRILFMGVTCPEIWVNIGLCAFFSSQYDIAVNCILRALTPDCSDELASDVWYNVSHIALGVGDVRLAHQALRLSVTLNSFNIEALTNLAYIELREKKYEEALSTLRHACSTSPTIFEPYYALALVSTQLGDFQTALVNVNKAVELAPDNFDVIQLKEQLQNHFFM